MLSINLYKSSGCEILRLILDLSYNSGNIHRCFDNYEEHAKNRVKIRQI